MGLDELYNVIKDAKYPIKNRLQLARIISTHKVEFNGHVFDNKNISLQIDDYPIESASELIKSFLDGYNKYNLIDKHFMPEYMQKAKT